MSLGVGLDQRETAIPDCSASGTGVVMTTIFVGIHVRHVNLLSRLREPEYPALHG